MKTITIHPEVDTALRAGRPVVALETAVVTHGLPRDPRPALRRENDPGWDASAPLHFEAARSMERAVRREGAVPAIVAVLDGTLRIGLDEASLVRLAEMKAPEKASAGSLAAHLAAGHTAGTTVSATLAACGLPGAGPIRIFATGGIGGVHAGWTTRPDVSADLRALAETPACVVCAGAKSILDVPATIESMETLGVPVLGYRTDAFPLFQAPGRPALAAARRIDDLDEAVKVCLAHWGPLARRTAVLLTCPPPEAEALSTDEVIDVAREANEEAERRNVHGAVRTPFLLGELERRTGGRSLAANVALLVQNASIAGALAVALASRSGPDSPLTRNP